MSRQKFVIDLPKDVKNEVLSKIFVDKLTDVTITWLSNTKAVISCNDNIEKINQLFLIHKIKILNDNLFLGIHFPLYHTLGAIDLIHLFSSLVYFIALNIFCNILI